MAGTVFRFNTSSLAAGIRREIASHPERVRHAMNAVGGFLAGEAKDRTPVDEGFLTADVTSETVQNAKSFAAVIYIPANAPSSSYAVAMHEGFYQLGKNSLAKQAKTGKVAGRKYLTRAIDDNRPRIAEIMRGELAR